MRRRPATTAVSLTALVLAGLAVPITGTAARAAEPARTATLVGSLQDELGCPGDWQPECTATDLTRVGEHDDVCRATSPCRRAPTSSRSRSTTRGTRATARAAATCPLVLGGPATLRFTYDDTTHAIGDRPDRPVRRRHGGRRRSSPPPRCASSRRASASTSSWPTASPTATRPTTRAASPAARLETGFDPTDEGFYHGGDLKGLTSKLDYIKGLGTTAIWLTPSFKNRAVQGTGSDASAGYHGYWITDFTQIDPHLGTNADMKALISAAHAKGMKVYFDIITNHTADVISYEGGKHAYVSKETEPYKDADGNVFDDADVAGKPMCAGDPGGIPRLLPGAVGERRRSPTCRSSAATPTRTVKVPAWLNDPTLYHNRGDSTYRRRVLDLRRLLRSRRPLHREPQGRHGHGGHLQVAGSTSASTASASTPSSTSTWSSGRRSRRRSSTTPRQTGNDDFFMFGEVFDGNPAYTSQFTTKGKLPATLDFGFQGAALGFAQGKATTGMRDLFAGDDYYTDTDSNAYELPTFLGNHDMGRVGAMLLAGGGHRRQTCLDRDRLANVADVPHPRQPGRLLRRRAGLHRTDERLRRQARPPGHVRHADADLPGRRHHRQRQPRRAPARTTTRRARSTSRSRRSPRCVQAHPALADGAQVHRYASDAAGIYAFSRIDKAAKREYVVVTNNATTAKSATFATYSAGSKLVPLLGGSGDLRADKAGRVTVTVPPLSVAVYRANATMASSPVGPDRLPDLAQRRRRRRRPRRDRRRRAGQHLRRGHLPLPSGRHVGLDPDRHRRQRALPRLPRRQSGLAKGTLARVPHGGQGPLRPRLGDVDLRRRRASRRRPGGGGGGGVGPVTQPDAVSVPGSHNTEMGCPGDWQPDCAQAQLALDAKDDIWKGTSDRSRPATTSTRPRSTSRGTRTTAPAASRAAATSPTRPPAARSASTTTTARTG